jgi:hypothetical protein
LIGAPSARARTAPCVTGAALARASVQLHAPRRISPGRCRCQTLCAAACCGCAATAACYLSPWIMAAEKKLARLVERAHHGAAGHMPVCVCVCVCVRATARALTAAVVVQASHVSNRSHEKVPSAASALPPATANTHLCCCSCTHDAWRVLCWLARTSAILSRRRRRRRWHCRRRPRCCQHHQQRP